MKEKAKSPTCLAKEADIIVRFQGGANAGHTIVNNYGKFALHTLTVRMYFMNIQQALLVTVLH